MKTPEHVGIVWNPAKTERADLEASLAAAIADGDAPQASWFETTVEDPGYGMAWDAIEAGADLVIAVGGDGTVRAVAECLAQADADVELGIVPQGTGNLLARNLDLPLSDLDEAFALAMTGAVQRIDLGWVDAGTEEGTERHAFTVMAGVGIDAHMIIETAEGLKDKVGWLAYLESLGRALSASEVIDMTLSFDGDAASREQAHTLMVGNCGMLQGGITLLPDADPTDGELDILLLKADGVADWLETLRTMVWDNGLKRMVAGQEEAESSDSVLHRQVSSVDLELGRRRVLELDGDELGECSRIAFSVQPSAIAVRVAQP